MSLWDDICDNVICPLGGLIVDGVEATGRGIDTVVTTGIDVVGGGLDYAIDAIKENPGKSALIAAAAVATGGASIIAGSAVSAGSALGVVAGSSLGGTGLAAGAAAATGGISSTVASSLVNAGLSTATKTLGGRVVQSVGYMALSNLGQSFVDNVLRDKVIPVKGSIIYCELALAAEHSGIYLGKGKIAHLDGSGAIRVVSTKTFLNRLGGWNNAISIYVSCNDNVAVGSENIAKRARAAAGRKREYNLILDNCHQFSSGCVTGNFENSDNFLWMLKDTAMKSINVTTWRVWDIANYD